MAENLLTDSKLRSAARERDGAYLRGGGGLRIRLLAPSRNHPKGARLAEFHYKVKVEGEFRHGALHLGTIGEPFADEAGKVRAFSLADARRARDAARSLVARGIDPREAQRLKHAEAAEAQRQRLAELDSRRTVRQAFERWCALYLSAHRKDGGKGVEDLFRLHVLPSLGDRTLDTVRRQDVIDILDRLVAAGKRRSANLALMLLRQFLRWCVARDWLDADPTLLLKKSDFGGREKPRQRALATMEIVELRDKMAAAKLPKRMQHAVWLLLATGCRVGELSAARRADFDLLGATWHLPTSKAGRPHLIHLSDFAVEHLRALLAPSEHSQYILPARMPKPGAGEDPPEDRPIGHEVIGKAVADRQREQPLTNRTPAAATLLLARGKWTPHDLRRTMATRMREGLGVSGDVVERCLNHKPQGIIGVYQTGELLAERKAAFEAWGAELERLMALDATNIVALPDARAA